MPTTTVPVDPLVQTMTLLNRSAPLVAEIILGVVGVMIGIALLIWGMRLVYKIIGGLARGVTGYEEAMGDNLRDDAYWDQMNLWGESEDGYLGP